MLLVRKENICWLLENRFCGYISNAWILVIGVPVFLSVWVSVAWRLLIDNRFKLNVFYCTDEGIIVSMGTFADQGM